MRGPQHTGHFIADDGVRYAPGRLRWNESVVATGLWVTVGVIALANVPEPWAYPLLAVLLGGLGWSVHRAWRLGLRVTNDRICVDNYWRTYRFTWADVADVGVGMETMGVMPQPAILFRLRTGRIIRAQATPQKFDPREEMIDRLAGLAPRDVKFHRDLRS
jgi:hypothetical protein